MVLIGASGHAKVILDILEKNEFTVDYLLDADSNIKELAGYNVIEDKNHIDDIDQEYIVSIGSNSIRKRVSEQRNVKFGWAIHPDSILGDDVSIGQGTVVMAGAIINSSTTIGEHCIINTASSIDHDCRLEDFVHVSPSATLCGGITVGEGTHIGAGATIIPNIKIGKWATIGAGAVVIRDVPDYAKVVGNPAQIIELNDGE